MLINMFPYAPERTAAAAVVLEGQKNIFKTIKYIQTDTRKEEKWRYFHIFKRSGGPSLLTSEISKFQISVYEIIKAGVLHPQEFSFFF